MQIEITVATVIETQYGPDHVFLETKLPAATYPFVGTESLSFNVAAGSGAKYNFKSERPD